MAFTLIATPGASDANSSATGARADDYFAARLYTDVWDAAAPPKKEQALAMATGWLDTQVRWAGAAADADQALAWPRVGVADPNTGFLLDSDTIPRQVVEATAALAQQLLIGNLTADNDAQAQGLKSLKAGPVELVFRDDVQSKPLPDAIFAMLRDLAYTAGPDSVNTRLVRC